MPLVTYSLLRLALFVAATAVLVLVGTGWLLAVALGAVLAALLSYLLLRGPRDRAVLWMQARAEARGDRPRLSRHATEDAAVEDAAVDGAVVPDADVHDGVREGGDGRAVGAPGDGSSSSPCTARRMSPPGTS